MDALTGNGGSGARKNTSGMMCYLRFGALLRIVGQRRRRSLEPARCRKLKR